MTEGLEVLVDPRVSRAKFDRELAEYRALEDTYIRQGWWMVKAEFPEVFVVFGTADRQPPLVAFGAMLDFTNYDLWPPSVKLVNPFTRVPYKAQELPTMLLRRAVSGRPPETPTDSPGAATSNTQAQAVQVQLQHMMQFYQPESEPFLCLPGTREYHDHPSHSGDSWLLHRGQGEGTLYYLLNTLYTYGVHPMMLETHVHVRLAVQPEVQAQVRLTAQLNRVPE